MLRLFLLLVVFVACQNNVNAINACSDSSDTKNHVNGGDFEVNADDMTTPSLRIIPKGWNAFGSVILIKNGATPWGDNNSTDGNIFVGIQRGLSAIEQTITGLDPSKHYTLGFLASERKGYGPFELLDVVVNSVTVLAHVNPPDDSFQSYSVPIRSDKDGKVKITFRNTSPLFGGGKFLLDTTIFLDKIEVMLQRDCGKGASCQPNSGDPQNQFTCSCSDPGYTGAEGVNKNAACDNTADDLQTLRSEYEAYKTSAMETITSLENVVSVLRQDLLDVRNDITAVNNNVTSVANDLQEVKTTADTSSASLNNLRELLKTFVTSLIDPVDSNKRTSIEPEIKSTAEGSLVIGLEEGSHVLVNSDPLLPENEIRDLVKSAVEDALKKIGEGF
eukprot:m.2930 g.2930  ORF g.2930 m.2930 type:complete len:389 (+) comp2625_c0_seq1:114-1280(+)